MLRVPQRRRVRSFTVDLFIYVFLLYVIGASLYELSLGATAAQVREATRDFKLPVANSTLLIPIDQLPFQVYYDMAVVMGLFLPIPVFVATIAAIEFVYFLRTKDAGAVMPMGAFTVGAFSVTLALLGMGIFVAQKYEDKMDADSRALWNSIDTRFMYVYQQMMNVVFVTIMGLMMFVVFLKLKLQAQVDAEMYGLIR